MSFGVVDRPFFSAVHVVLDLPVRANSHGKLVPSADCENRATAVLGSSKAHITTLEAELGRPHLVTVGPQDTSTVEAMFTVCVKAAVVMRLEPERD